MSDLFVPQVCMVPGRKGYVDIINKQSYAGDPPADVEIVECPVVVTQNHSKPVITKKKGPFAKFIDGALGAASGPAACNGPQPLQECDCEDKIVENEIEVCSEENLGEVGKVKQGEETNVVFSLPEDSEINLEDPIIYFQHNKGKANSLTYSKTEIISNTLIFDVKASPAETMGEISIVVKFIEGEKQVSLRGTLEVEEGAPKTKGKGKSKGKTKIVKEKEDPPQEKLVPKPIGDPDEA